MNKRFVPHAIVQFINKADLNTGNSSWVARLGGNDSGPNARAESSALRGASEFVAAVLSERGSVSAARGFARDVETGSTAVQNVSAIVAEVAVEQTHGLSVNDVAAGSNRVAEISEESFVSGTVSGEARGGTAGLRDAGGADGVRAAVRKASGTASGLNAGGSSRLASVREAVAGAGNGVRNGFLVAGGAARSLDAGGRGGGDRDFLVGSGGGRADVRNASSAARSLEAGGAARGVLASGDLPSRGCARGAAHLRRPVLQGNSIGVHCFSFPH